LKQLLGLVPERRQPKDSHLVQLKCTILEPF
jgi:hypothetical protein